MLLQDCESPAGLQTDLCQPKQRLPQFPFKPATKFLDSTGSKNKECCFHDLHNMFAH